MQKYAFGLVKVSYTSFNDGIPDFQTIFYTYYIVKQMKLCVSSIHISKRKKRKMTWIRKPFTFCHISNRYYFWSECKDSSKYKIIIFFNDIFCRKPSSRLIQFLHHFNFFIINSIFHCIQKNDYFHH